MTNERHSIQREAKHILSSTRFRDGELIKKQFGTVYRFGGDLNAGLSVDGRGSRVRVVVCRKAGTSSIRLDTDNSAATIDTVAHPSYEVIPEIKSGLHLRLRSEAKPVMDFRVDSETELAFLRALMHAAGIDMTPRRISDV